MSQLLVRDIEPAIVKKLRTRAAAQGVSVEEAHRQLLRAALIGKQPAPQSSFTEYLLSIPRGEGIDFPRASDLPRKVRL